MGITLTSSAQNAACNAVVDLIDVGTTDANGDLVIMTSGDAEVATLAFSNPAFGSASSGVATAAAIADDTNATGGTAALFKFQNRNNVEVLRGTVGTSSADLIISSLNIGAGDTIQVSSFTVTMPASA
jgi:hypothetical protein